MQLAFNGATVLALALKKTGLNTASGPGAFMREADLISVLTGSGPKLETCFRRPSGNPGLIEIALHRRYVENCQLLTFKC